MTRSWWMKLLVAMALLATAVMVAPSSAERTALVAGQRWPVVQMTARSAPGGDTPLIVAPESSTPPRPVLVKLEGLVLVVAKHADGYALMIAQSSGVTETQVVVTAGTLIRPIGLTPKAEDYVTIEAVAELNGDVVATYIRVRTEDEWVNQSQIEFRGLITGGPEAQFASASRKGLAEDNQQWIVAGKAIQVDGRDIIGVPRIGLYAHVKGLLGRDGLINATEMKILDPAEAAAQFEFEGTIQAGPPDLGVWVIDGVEGVVGQSTSITGTAEIGAIGEVRGKRLADGTAVFEAIDVLGAQERTVRLEGVIEDCAVERVEGVIEGYLVVDAQHIEVDGMTFIDESEARLAPGMWAQVTARRVGSQLRALRVTVRRAE